MGSILSVLITAGLGTWLAYVWQQRTAKQARFFDATKSQFDMMRGAATTFANLIGRRLYAMHRICLLGDDSERFNAAFDELIHSIEAWNNEYLQIELNVRTLFEHSTALDLETLQSRLNALSNIIVESAKAKSARRRKVVHDVALLRHAYFEFLQKMINETDHLFRQMHFGVRLMYSRRDIERFSTLQLIKSLLSGSEHESSIIRSPTDFGLPVDAWNARLGIN
jgi:hypothetical protein